MGTSTASTWQPKWWNAEHTTAWDRIKESLRRDWEQTKSDVGVKGANDLNQNVSDTVNQASNIELIPPAGQPNTTESRQGWTDELPMQVGFSAAHHYQKRAWDESVENDVRKEWETNQTSSGTNGGSRTWEHVKGAVRHGYEQFINASRL